MWQRFSWDYNEKPILSNCPCSCIIYIHCTSYSTFHQNVLLFTFGSGGILQNYSWFFFLPCCRSLFFFDVMVVAKNEESKVCVSIFRISGISFLTFASSGWFSSQMWSLVLVITKELFCQLRYTWCADVMLASSIQCLVRRKTDVWGGIRIYF